MRKLLVSILVGLMLVIFGVVTGIKKEINSNNVQAVQCMNTVNVGYRYNYVPKYIPTYCMDSFEDYIYDIYLTEYCVNDCETCDRYYYEHCFCCDCDSDEECCETDYQSFIDDNMDMILDEYLTILTDIQEDYKYESYVLYSF